jgi:ATP-dependent DNA ligase
VYKPGSREAVLKVKHHKTCDCVIVGYRKNGSRVASLLLGLYGDDGALDFVGHTSGISGALQKDLQARLPPLVESGHLGDGRMPGGQSRWSQGKDLEWVEVRPEIVCEVRYDKMESDRFRHGTRFLRFRPDKDPTDCRWDQVRPSRKDGDPTISGLLAAAGSLPRS